MSEFDAASTPASRSVTSSTPQRSVSHFDFGDGEERAQQLPPVDGGKAAWLFTIASTVLECVDGALWSYLYTRDPL